MDNEEVIEQVTIVEKKPKNPGQVAWGKKLGQLKKNKTVEESYGMNKLYIPISIVGVCAAGYIVYTLRNVEKPKQLTAVTKEKLNITL